MSFLTQTPGVAAPQWRQGAQTSCWEPDSEVVVVMLMMTMKRSGRRGALHHEASTITNTLASSDAVVSQAISGPVKCELEQRVPKKPTGLSLWLLFLVHT